MSATVYDLIVVGDGIEAISLAYAMRAQDKTVVVVSEEVIGSGTDATSACAGLLLTDVKDVDLQRRSNEIVRALENVSYRETSALLPSFSLMRASAQLFDMLWTRYVRGRNASVVGGLRARDIDPSISPSIRSALYIANVAQCDPRKVLLQMKADAESGGVVSFEESKTIDSLVRFSNADATHRYQIDFADGGGTIKGQRLVLANGAKIDTMAKKFFGMTFDIIPVKFQNHVSASVDGIDEEAGVVMRTSAYTNFSREDARDVPRGVTTDSRGRERGFVYESKYDAETKEFHYQTLRKPTTLDDALIEVDALRRAVEYTERARDLSEGSVVTSDVRVGFMGFSRDNEPVVERVLSDMWIFGGLGANHLTKGPALAEEVATWIQTDRTPNRFLKRTDNASRRLFVLTWILPTVALSAAAYVFWQSRQRRRRRDGDDDDATFE